MLIGVFEILHRTFGLNKKHWLLFIKYTLLSIAPGIAGAVVLLFVWPLIILALLSKSYLLLSGLILLFAAICIVIILLGVWFNSALILAVDQCYKKNTPEPLSQNLQASRQVIWQALGVSFLASIYSIWPLFLIMLAQSIFIIIFKIQAINISFLFGFIFGVFYVYGFGHLIYYIVKLNFAIYFAVVEKNSIFQALKNSRQIVAGRWWGILFRLVVPSVVFWAILFILNTVFDFFSPLNYFIYIALFLLMLFINLIMVPLPLSAILIVFEEAKNNPHPTAPPLTTAN